MGLVDSRTNLTCNSKATLRIFRRRRFFNCRLWRDFRKVVQVHQICILRLVCLPRFDNPSVLLIRRAELPQTWCDVIIGLWGFDSLNSTRDIHADYLRQVTFLHFWNKGWKSNLDKRQIPKLRWIWEAALRKMDNIWDQ